MPLLRHLLPLTAAALACSAAPALAAPVNDDFASATVLGSSSQQTFNATTVGATVETGEPWHWGQNRSVWYRWTPAATGGTKISACGTGLRIMVYTGSTVDKLTRVNGGAGDCGGDAQFAATAGTVYRIAVDADTNPAGASGTVKLDQKTTKPNVALDGPLEKVGGAGDVWLKETTGADPVWFTDCEVVGKPVQDGQCFKKDGRLLFRWQGLATGTYTMKVGVRDDYGNIDPTPLTKQFTVDSDPPETAFTSQPPAPTDKTAAFTFVSSEPGSTFQCSYDGAPWTPCTSPWGVPVTTLGGHYLRVRAFDAYGNGDVTPAHISWIRQDPKPPVVPQAPKASPAPTAPVTATAPVTTSPPPVRTTATAAATTRCAVRPSLPATATRAGLARGVRLVLSAPRGCRWTASLKRGTRTLARWSGTGRVVRTVRLGRTTAARLPRGARLAVVSRTATSVTTGRMRLTR